MSVLVTGASRGIGAAIAGSMLDRGTCYGTCRPQTFEAGGLSEDLRWIPVDLGEDEAPEQVVQALGVNADFTGLSGVVLNAGVAQPERFAKGEDAAAYAEEHIRVNLQGPLRLLHALVARGCLSEGCSVVMIGSNLARRGLAGKVSYAASKAGLEGATRALAKELGPMGVRVNTVAPGLVVTDMTRAMGSQALEAYAQEVPLGRVGKAEDVAAVVEFFLGDGALYVSGQVVDVDGGWGC